jgi:hypothetical protein
MPATYFSHSISDKKKSFIKLSPVANFINVFWHHLYCYQHIALIFDSGYAARGINYAKKVL